MVVALDPAVVEKITRRAKRAWEDFDKGGKAAYHRISHLTRDELKFRLRHEPGERSRAGKKIKVVRKGKDILVAPRDPKLDLQEKKNLTELKDREGTVRAYRLVAKDGSGPQKNSYDTKLKVGDKLTASLAVGSLERCKTNYSRGSRILAVTFDAADITSVDDEIAVKAGEVAEELDLVALGLKKKAKPGVLDCLTDQDVKDLVEDHVGTLRAYKHVTKDGDSPHQAQKIRYELGRKYEEPNADTNRDKDCSHGLNVASLEWVQRDRGKGGKDARIFAVEMDADDLACVPAKTDGKFRTRKLTVVAEIDPQTGKEIASIPPPAPPPAKPSIIEELYNRAADGKKVDPAPPATPKAGKPEKPAKAKAKDGLLDKLKKTFKGKNKGKE